MEPQSKFPLIVIVGPTASGKSELGLRIADLIASEAESYKYEAAALRRGLLKQQASAKTQLSRGDEKKQNQLLPRINLTGVKGAEIICADSRTVYKGMDIGTAKPAKKDQARARHHLLDVIEPNETFTAASFKARAVTAMESITNRHNMPIMVGGTGLYIDGVIFDFAFLPPIGQEGRDYLNSLSLEELHKKFEEQGITLPENSQNKRHLVRRLETNGMVPVKKGLRENTLVLGVQVDKEEIEQRVKQRLAAMLASGLEQEVRGLVQKYGWDAPGLSAVGYQEWRQYFNEKQTLADTIQLLQNHTMQYAKRQRTWFKRNQYITWIKNSSEAESIVK